MPQPCAFTSADWVEEGGAVFGPGEDPLSSRPWSDGATLPGVTGTGGFCGDPSYWQAGFPSDALPVEFVGGVPACCPSTRPRGRIGVEVGPEYSGIPPCVPAVDLTNVRMYMFNTRQGVWGPFLPVTATNNFAFWDYAALRVDYPNRLQGQLFSTDSGGCVSFTAGEFFQVDRVFTFRTIAKGTSEWFANSFVFLSPAGDISNIDTFYIFVTGPSRYAATLGVALGVESGHELGVAVGLVSGATATYAGSLGLAAGLESERVLAAVGLAAGLVSAATATYAGSLGVAAGLVSAATATYSGSLGLAASPGGSLRVPVSGSVGAEVSPSSGLLARLSGSVGAEVSPSSGLLARLSGSVGVKPGVSGTPVAGIVTACCPVVIPLTLTVVSGGLSTTATWSAAAGGWPFTDPQSGLNFTLTCFNTGGGVFKWEARLASQTHCVQSFTVTSAVCRPLALSITTTVTQVGGTCPTVGTYPFTISP